MGLLRELFVMGQFANAGDDEAKLNEIREQERKYIAYQMRQEQAFDNFLARVGRFFK